jgi:hypothetical protein
MCEQYSVSQAIPPSGLWDRNNFRSARNAGGISRGLGLARPRPNLYSRPPGARKGLLVVRARLVL